MMREKTSRSQSDLLLVLGRNLHFKRTSPNPIRFDITTMFIRSDCAEHHRCASSSLTVRLQKNEAI